MNPTLIGGGVFACTLGGALCGIWLRTRLPSEHLSDESKDTIKLGIGLIATMTALVLGLVTASAKSSFDVLDAAVKQSATEALALDRVLARYGDETREIRSGLKAGLGHRIEMTWPEDASRPARLDPSEVLRGGEEISDQIRALSPQNESQRWLRSRAEEISEALLEARWKGFGGGTSSVPTLFLLVLGFWLTITFTSFGLFAPWNATVVAVLVVCALSVASAVFLILEMDGAFQGFIHVSPDPMRFAYDRLGQ